MLVRNLARIVDGTKESNFMKWSVAAVMIQNDKNSRIWFKVRSMLSGSFPRHELSFLENVLGSLLNQFILEIFIRFTSKFIFQKWKFMSWKRAWKHTSHFKSYPTVLVILDHHSCYASLHKIRLLCSIYYTSKIPHQHPRTWAPKNVRIKWYLHHASLCK